MVYFSWTDKTKHTQKAFRWNLNILVPWMLICLFSGRRQEGFSSYSVFFLPKNLGSQKAQRQANHRKHCRRCIYDMIWGSCWTELYYYGFSYNCQRMCVHHGATALNIQSWIKTVTITFGLEQQVLSIDAVAEMLSPADQLMVDIETIVPQDKKFEIISFKN